MIGKEFNCVIVGGPYDGATVSMEPTLDHMRKTAFVVLEHDFGKHKYTISELDVEKRTFILNW